MKKQFSWEKPIEDNILEFVQSMGKQMSIIASKGQEEVKAGAEHYANAYRIIEEYILNQKKIKSENK